tara:strand:+ start:394 stop:807 length:414 start_codon:yes stop_codon:yes gene_type:complete
VGIFLLFIFAFMKDKQVFSKRAFLNKEGYHSNASIVTSIENASYGGGLFYGSLKISDCSKQIELAVDLESIEMLDNTLYKLSKIIDVVSAYRDALEVLKPKIKAREKKVRLEKEAGELQHKKETQIALEKRAAEEKI